MAGMGMIQFNAGLKMAQSIQPAAGFLVAGLAQVNLGNASINKLNQGAISNSST